jgi:DNA-binding Lrp family transcriptional regulator
MKAIVLIRIQTGEIKNAWRDLKRVRAVSKAHVTFGPYDAVVEIEARDLQEIGKIVAYEIQPIPGVRETLTCLAVDCEFPTQETIPAVDEARKEPLFGKN